MESLRKWNAKPAVDKTYSNFNILMHEDYLELQDVGGSTVQTCPTLTCPHGRFIVHVCSWDQY